MNRFTLVVLCGLCAGIAACEKPAASALTATVVSPTATPAASRAVEPPGQTPATDSFDACTLLTRDEVAEVQGSPVTDAKSSVRTSDATSVGQCFYTTSEFSRSVSLTVTRALPGANGGRGPRDIWQETFGRFSQTENGGDGDHDNDGAPPEAGGEREREKESKPPLKVEGLGEGAFWTSGIGGTLYVLKENAFIRIGIGSVAKDEEKLNQAKTLAAKAIQRLK